MTGAGQLVEIQGTAEGKPFTSVKMERLLALVTDGIRELTQAQRAVLKQAGVALSPRA
jgi:ribonuclease PH